MSGHEGRALAVVLALASVVAGCPKAGGDDRKADAAAAAPVASKEAPADPAHGKELVLTFQCNRCHDGTGHPAAAQNKHCVHCHKDIMEGRFDAPAASIARWRPRVKEYADAPSLTATGERLSRAWIEQYLLSPTHLRPNLHAYMPRLAITPAEARDVAAYLAPAADAPADAGGALLASADLGKGRQLLDTKGCGGCHVMSGVAEIASSAPPAMDGRELERAKRLAPDLRFTRDRMTPPRLVAWLRDPKAVKPDTPMPKVALSDAEIVNIAGYIYSAELTAPPPPKKIERLPVLSRKVTFQEVDAKVFHRTCWHCHGEPDFAIGDGGPGNSGGLGFKPRGLDLSNYNGIAAGFLDDRGERQSVFAPEVPPKAGRQPEGPTKDKDGVARLVRALLARHDEIAGAQGPVRGMPLGYDPLPPEQIQLVETWIAQGRPR